MGSDKLIIEALQKEDLLPLYLIIIYIFCQAPQIVSSFISPYSP